jgi:hypothetical protein
MQPAAQIYGSPIIEPLMPKQARKAQQMKISSLRSCLEAGESEKVAEFLEKAPAYLPFIVAALTDHNQTISFTAEWCIRRLSCTLKDHVKVLLKHSINDFLCSPWINSGKMVGNPRAQELSEEMREVYNFISN